MPDMPYSPTLSAGTSTLGRLMNTLDNYAQNASSREKPMLTVELTYIALSISDQSENSDPEGAMCSMSTACTLIFHLRTQHHRRVSTMRARMVTLWQGGLEDQMLAKSLETEVAGMISWLQRVERSFTNSVWSLIRDHCVSRSDNYKSTLTGVIEMCQRHINIQKTSDVYMMTFQSLVDGYSKYLECLYQVSILYVEEGDPPGTKSSASRYACSGGPSPPLSSAPTNNEKLGFGVNPWYYGVRADSVRLHGLDH